MTENILRFDRDKTVLHENDLVDHMDAETIVIPVWMEKIEEGSFAHGRRHWKIVMQDNPYYKLDQGFFYEKESGKLLQYIGEEKDIVVPAGIKVIGKWAFYECHADKILFSREIKEIHEEAFTTCLMKEAVFPFYDARIYFPERDIRMRQHMLEGFGKNGMFDFQRYDEDLSAGFIEPERMREIAARLKWPYELKKKEHFLQILENNFIGAAEELGRAEDTEALQWLIDIDVINHENVDCALEVLHALKNLEPYMFLSRYKAEHWQNDFDFSL